MSGVELVLRRKCRDVCVMESRAPSSHIEDEESRIDAELQATNGSAPTIHRFLVGTSELKSENNGIFVCEYDDESASCFVASGSPFPHESGEIWSLSPRPVLNADDSRSVLTCFGRSNSTNANGALSRAMALTTIQGTRSSVAQAKLDGSEGAIHAAWDKTGLRAASSHEDGGIRLWTTRDGEHITLETKSITCSHGMDARDVVWDPLSPEIVAFACGTSLLGLDTRKPSAFAYEINIPGCLCRSVDVNPNRIHTLVSGGEDGAVRFWDTRKPAEPVQVLSKGGHSHWITKVRFNPFHDQLVLSASTDGTVCLWRAASVSSAPLSADLDLTEDLDTLTGSGKGEFESSVVDDSTLYGLRAMEDGLIQSFADNKHDSVYGIAWSSVDAWTFASLSYNDGTFVVRNVPSAEKYKILL